jgi:hypothetical protein
MFPRGFSHRKGANGPYAVRVFIDFPLVEGKRVAAEVAVAIAAEEANSGGEPVTAQSVLRRAIRKGLDEMRAKPGTT